MQGFHIFLIICCAFGFYNILSYLTSTKQKQKLSTTLHGTSFDEQLENIDIKLTSLQNEIERLTREHDTWKYARIELIDKAYTHAKVSSEKWRTKKDENDI